MFAFSVALAAALVSAHALSTPSHFTSSMVLQRGVIVNLWGLDVAGAAINVNYRGLALPPVTVDATGRFSVPLPAMPKNSTPAAIIITSPTGQLTLDDTVVGDVYFCSGQRSATATGRREYLSLGRDIATERGSAPCGGRDRLQRSPELSNGRRRHAFLPCELHPPFLPAIWLSL